jgi:hypothetical protein
MHWCRLQQTLGPQHTPAAALPRAQQLLYPPRRQGSSVTCGCAARAAYAAARASAAQRHHHQQAARRRGLVAARASEQQRQAAPAALAELELAVPSEQRPCNELLQLQQAWLYSWATLPQGDYIKRLATLFLFFAGGPPPRAAPRSQPGQPPLRGRPWSSRRRGRYHAPCPLSQSPSAAPSATSRSIPSRT